MNRPSEPTFDQRIADWLEEDPNHAPREVLGTVLAAYPSIPQRHASRMPWRLPTMFNNRALFGAAAAVLVVALASGTYLVLRNQAPAVGASPSPAAQPSASPQASAADPMSAYRTARNQICLASAQVFSDNTDLVGLYDPATTPERRAIVNANAQEIADAIAAQARDLALLQPPAELAEAHTTDVAHAEALAAIFAAQVQLLRDGRYSDAAAQEVAAEATGNLRKPFETEYKLFNC